MPTRQSARKKDVRPKQERERIAELHRLIRQIRKMIPRRGYRILHPFARTGNEVAEH